MTDEDRMLARLKDALVAGRVRDAHADALRAAATFNADLAGKAMWVWDQVAPLAQCELQAGQATLAERGLDAEQWLLSWARFYLSAATTWAHAGRGAPSDTADTLALHGTLLLGWHHAVWPALARQAAEAAASVVIARRSPWLDATLGDNAVCLGEPGVVRQLGEAFASGRPVAAMLDYCYSQTRRVCWTMFLGRPARTPSGVLALAARHNYDIVVAEPRGTSDGWRLDQRLPAGQFDERDAAGWANSCLSRQILGQPSQWLLWPSLDRRWSSAEASDPVPFAPSGPTTGPEPDRSTRWSRTRPTSPATSLSR